MLQFSQRHQKFRPLIEISIQLFIVTLLPTLLTGGLWQAVLSGVRPLSWDGAGHFALAQIYNNSIFPDTFGWTNAFFAGMPHPNFYPPLFYWLIALLAHLPFVSFLLALKIVIVFPILLIPAATWFLAWKLSNKNRMIAFYAGLAIVPLLVDYRMHIISVPYGINYTSTFLTGLYSHPLSYLFLILWYAVYSDRKQPLWRIALSAMLLALTALSGFYAASVTVLFIIATLTADFRQIIQAADPPFRKSAVRRFLEHFVSPLLAFCLSLFWLAPVLSARDYLVTQPSRVPFGELVPVPFWFWYAAALVGVYLWRRHERRFDDAAIYLLACLALGVLIFASGLLAPRWLPIHPSRLLATFNFLLAAPVGITLAFLIRQLATLCHTVISALLEASRQNINLQHEPHNKTQNKKTKDERIKGGKAEDDKAKDERAGKELLVSPLVGTAAAFLFIFFAGFLLIEPPSFRLAFYQTEDREAIDPVLQYAREHKDGRYLVEILPFRDVASAHEARAINNYLGAQGNEVLTLFFREASPNIIFFSPLVDRFSIQADPFGISSVLSDDEDFVRQPPAEHLRQLRLVGARYLIVRTAWARQQLEGQPEVKPRRDFGLWSVYELKDEGQPKVRALAYKPALVVTTFNVKGRRNSDSDFIRFGEEQLMSNWSDVRLARAPEMKLDRLEVDDGFGALIIDAYQADDETAALNRLGELAQKHQLILLENESGLFHRIESDIGELHGAEVIRRQPEPPGEWITPGAPTRSYETSQLRRIWRRIQSLLDERKIPVDAASIAKITGQIESKTIRIDSSASSEESIPVLIETSYHPNWKRTDGAAVYPTTPFFMLTFVHEPTQLNFARRITDWIGLAVSAVTFVLLCVSLVWYYGRSFVSQEKRSGQRNSS